MFNASEDYNNFENNYSNEPIETYDTFYDIYDEFTNTNCFNIGLNLAKEYEHNEIINFLENL